MAKRGRPVKGPGNVEHLPGSIDAKTRLRVIMETISGTKSVKQACEELGIEKSAFYKLRDKALAGALEHLEPRQVGRPRAIPSPKDKKIEELEKELLETRMHLEAAYIREELSVAMPHVLINRKSGKDKKKKEKAKKKKSRQDRKRNTQ
jgi:transposase-like protein